MKRVLNYLLDFRATIIMLVIYAMAMALATFIEAKQGTAAAKEIIYHNILFILLQALMVTNFVAITIRRKLFQQRKWGLLISHYGFVVALLGALVTHLFSSESMLYVREGQSSNVAYSDQTVLTYNIEVDGRDESVTIPFASDEQYSQTHGDVTISVKGHGSEMGSGEMVMATIKRGASEQRLVLQGARFRPSQSQTVEVGSAKVEIYFGAEQLTLPIDVYLEDFVLDRYGGSGSPSSYESYVTITYGGEKEDYHIFMNHIAYVGSYRLYQTSYDTDEKGTILTVNQDLVGMILSYAGYIMMLLGFILALVYPSSRFRVLLSKLKKLSATAALLLVSLSASGESYTPIGALKLILPSQEVSEKFSRVLVQNPSGRVEPMDSYARSLLTKIYRSSTYEGMDAVSVIISMINSPYGWSNTPVVYLSSPDLQDIFSGKSYISYNEVFDAEGNYLLTPYLDQINPKDPGSRSRMDKDILKLDEKINIMNLLFNGAMLNLFPLKDSPDGHWYSSGDDTSLFQGRDSMFVTTIMPWFSQECLASLESGNWAQTLKIVDMISLYQSKMAREDMLIAEEKITAELFYNKVNIFKICGIAYQASAFVLLLVLFGSLVGRPSRMARYLGIAAIVVIVAAFLYHTFGIGLRWYISGRSPWTNSYESMISISWTAILAGLLFARRSWAALGVAVMMGGAVAMISMLSFLDPQITPLVPVLKSYWLMFHVAIITSSYGFFGVSALLGIITMLMMLPKQRNQALVNKIKELTIINELSIIIGLILLTVGIFIGAVWANESWGRYWGWDPKEAWALISMVVYAIVIHCRFTKSLRGDFIFTAMSVWAFYSILMTFFGVNYYLTGMHSYSNGSSLSGVAVLLPTAFVALLTIFAYIRRDRK